MYRLNKIGAIKPKSAKEVKESRLGIGFEKLDRDAFDPEKAYDKIEAIGVKWVRIQSGWQKTEKEKGVYDFAWLDAIVDNIIARNMKPWMCVCYGNKLYGGQAEEYFGAVGCPPIHTEEQRTAWHNYCVALAKHYKGRVDHFEIWNEPDGSLWKHGPCGTELGEFTKASAKAIKEGNPDTYIIGVALARPRVKFLNEAFKTGMAEYLDAVSYHAYLFDDRKLSKYIKAVRGVIDLYKPSLEIIQGESGSQSKPFGNGALKVGGWTPRKQCKQQLRHLVTDLGMGVKFTSYFSCIDMMEALHGKVGNKKSYQDFGYFGVLGAEFDEDNVATGAYTPKPSYYSLQNLASLFAGDTKAIEFPIIVEDDKAPHCGNVPTLSCAEVEGYGFRLDNGSYAYAYWHPTNFMTTDFEGAVSFTSAAPGGKPKLVDPMDGSIYELPAEMAVEDGFGGMDLKLLPVRDYPLFLIFGEIS